MSRRIINAVGVAILAGLSLTIAAVGSRYADASDWVVRPVDLLSPLAENADIMVGPDGTAIVGYAPGSAPGGEVRLARLSPADKFFQRTNEAGGGYTASFAVDDYGNVYYGARSGDGPRVGQDLGGFGAMVSSLHPASATAVRIANPSIGVDPAGLPALAGMDQSGQRFISRFNVVEAAWQTELLGGLGFDSPALPAGDNCQSLIFDSAGGAVLAYVQRTNVATRTLVVARRENGVWTNVADAAAVASAGVSAAAAPDGAVGYAYVDVLGQLVFNSDGELPGVRETVAPLGGALTAHSLAYDADGNPAIVYAAGSHSLAYGDLHLARRNAEGIWTDETLPVQSRYASLAFDAAGNPLVVACTPEGITLLGTDIAGLLRGDFDLNDAADLLDCGGMVQSLRHRADYLAANAGMTEADLLPLGDFDGNKRFDDGDARCFADSLAAAPIPGLPDRRSGYAALDQADADPALGSGLGNLFNAALATGKPYEAGDSCGDLSGPVLGAADGAVDAADIDFLFARLDGSDLRVDLNGDGLFNRGDADVLVNDILGTFYGDANLDGNVDLLDLTVLGGNWRGADKGWSQGDFNGDRAVDLLDLTVLGGNWRSSMWGGNAETLSWSEALARAGFTTVPEPSSVALLAAGLLVLLARRRGKCS